MKKWIIILLLPIPIMAVGAFLKPFYLGVEPIQVAPSPTPTPGDGRQGALLSFNFDDGFLSAYEKGLPILDKAGIKTTQYIITGAFDMEGYVSEEQVLEMEKRGHEIGAHTRTHRRLTGLTQTEQEEEIIGSLMDLSSIGVRSVTTFSYPHGDVNENVEKIVRGIGFAGARITQPGLNDANTNRYRLKRFEADSSATIQDIQKAIDDAITQKKWLILLFHRVDEDSHLESVRHEVLEQIVEYIRDRDIDVVTTAEGLKLLKDIK